MTAQADVGFSMQWPALWRAVLIACLILVATAGCGAAGPTVRTWSEDVLLDDGTTVVIERSVEFKTTDSLARDAPNLIMFRSRLTLARAGNSTVAWEGQLSPIVLYRDSATQEWVMIAATVNCDTWRQNGRPRPPYWEYRYGVSGWESRPLAAASVGRPANLFVLFDEPLPSTRLTVSHKEHLLRQSNVSRTLRGVFRTGDDWRCS